MMRIPVYDEPQVAPEMGPAPRETFSPLEPLGAGLQRASAGVDQLSEHFRQAKQKADVAAATQAEADFEAKADQAFFGTPDGQTKGLMSLQGADAVKQSVPTLQSIELERQRVANSLKSDEAKQYFLASTAQSMVHRKAVAEQFVTKQVQLAHAAAAEARVQVGLKAIANAPADDHFADDQLKAMMAAKLGELHGQPDEVQTQALEELRSQAAQVRLRALLAPKADGTPPDYQRAQALLDKHREALGADVAEQYQRQISASHDADQYDQQSRTILAGAKVDGTLWLNPMKARAAVAALPNGTAREQTVRDEVQKRVEHELELNRQQKEQFGQDLLAQAKTIYAQSGNPNDARLAPIRAQLLDEHNNLGGIWTDFQNKIATERRSQRYAAAEEKRAQAAFDEQALYNFSKLSPEDQARTNIDDFANGQASPKARLQMQKIQKATVKELKTDGGLALDTMLKGVEAAAHDAGLDKDKRSRAPTDLRSAMTTWWLQQREANGGKVVDQQAIDKQLRHELQRVVVKGTGGFFGLGSDKQMTRAEAEANPDYAGKELVPVEGETPAPITQAQPAPPPKSLEEPPKPSPGDQAALDFLKANPNHPRAAALREVLKKKGLL